MALVHDIERHDRDRTRMHEPVRCTYQTFTEAGETLLQLDTYGSPESAQPESVKQTMQFDSHSAAQLVKLLKKHFNL